MTSSVYSWKTKPRVEGTSVGKLTMVNITVILHHVWLFVPLWTVARQVPLSLGFSWQEYWRGLPLPTPGHLLKPGIFRVQWSNPWILCLLHRTWTFLPTEPLGRPLSIHECILLPISRKPYMEKSCQSMSNLMQGKPSLTASSKILTTSLSFTYPSFWPKFFP